MTTIDIPSNMIFPQWLVNKTNTNINIISNSVYFQIPTIDCLKSHILLKIIDLSGNNVSKDLFSSQRQYFGFICPQGYNIQALHQVNTYYSDQNQQLIHKGSLDIQQVNTTVSNSVDCEIVPIIMGSIIKDKNNNNIYIKSVSQQNTLESILLNNYQTIPTSQTQYSFGELKNGFTYSNNLIDTVSSQMVINVQQKNTQYPISAIHSFTYSQTLQQLPKVTQLTNGCKYFDFSGIKIQENAVLRGYLYYVDDNNQIQHLFIYGYTYDILAISKDLKLDQLYIWNQCQQYYSNTDSFKKILSQYIQLIFSSTITQFITQVDIENAKTVSLQMLGGTIPILTSNLHTYLDSFMSTLCQDNQYGILPVCSCYLQALPVCVNNQCSQNGYKSKYVQDVDCSKQKINLNYQNCQTYQNLQAKNGNISIDKSIMSSCQQIINGQQDDQTSLQNKDTQITLEESLPKSNTNLYIYIILIIACFVILGVLIRILLKNKNKKNKQQQNHST